MAGNGTGRISGLARAMALMAPLALMGCTEDGQFDLAAAFAPAEGSEAAAAPGSGQTTELVERDVEAPEVFQVTEEGLWDGRPSLGGVWVAHPSVTDPERVIIRNTQNGQFVIGALFRREVESIGPDLQVSSDAAEALGMLAGAPASLNVTALRREEAALPAPTEAADPVAVLGGAGEIASAPLEPAPAGDAGLGADAAAALAASAAPAPAAVSPATTPAASSLDKPYVQIGIFSVRSNADNSATSMHVAGLTAQVIEQQSQGKTFWRVIVGPAASSAERARILGLVQELGYADAYAVRD